jgi:serine/threonine protein kinase
MQFIDGVSLRRRLMEAEPLELPEALDVVHDLALGLEAIHEQNIVHRDIKPDNVILARNDETRAWVPLWLDFGVARVDLRESASRGLLAGTPDYTAPELLEGKVASRASDVYALGLVLYEVLVGDLPFAPVASFSAAAGRASLRQAAPSLRRTGIPAALDELVQECLSPSPEQRPSSARLVADRLCAIKDSLRASSIGPRGGRAERSSRRRWLWLPAACAATTVGALVLLRSASPVPAVASGALEKSASNTALPGLIQPPVPASRPSPTPPALSPPETSARAKAKRTVVLQKPASAPSASHTVSDFGGRR